MPRGKKLVVQAVETFAEGMRPTFVDKLDAQIRRKNTASSNRR